MFVKTGGGEILADSLPLGEAVFCSSVSKEQVKSNAGYYRTLVETVTPLDNGAAQYSTATASPFVKKGDRLEVLTGIMTEGEPYPFQFMNWWFVAVRRGTGVDFFYVQD